MGTGGSVTVAARAAALVLACVLGLHPALLADADPVVVVLGVAGVGLVAAAFLPRAGWAAWAGAGALGAAYVVALALRDGAVDPFAPAVAVGRYLVVEAHHLASSERAGLEGRVWHSLTIGFLSALIVAGLLLAGAATTADGPLAVAATAVCGAVALFGLVSFLGPRTRSDD